MHSTNLLQVLFSSTYSPPSRRHQGPFNYKARGRHWVLDSGCTQYMTGDSRMFNSINENDNNGINNITFGDNGKGKVKGLGKIAISNDLSISNVLLVESLNFNLLSVAQLCDLSFKCIFGVNHKRR